jgi:hypothetical protein
MLNPAHLYFPEPDDPLVAPFATAFLRMMFAHAKFEARIRNLQNVITGEEGYGQRPKNQCSARERPKRISMLVSVHVGAIAEVGTIVNCLQRAIEPSDFRNWLAHGEWWRFVPETNAITVCAGVTWQPNEGPAHRDVTVADIDGITAAFDDLEAELWKCQSALEERRKSLAFHEAGHAVIGRVLALVCGPASIRPDHVSGGHTEIENPNDCVIAWEMRGKIIHGDPLLTYHVVLCARIIAVMAGGEAVAILLGSVPQGDDNDWRDIESMIEDLDPPSPLRCEARLRAITRFLIRRHKPRIELVADALLAEETLGTAQLDKLVGRSVQDVKPNLRQRDQVRMSK